jgi:hypothetical protein
MLRSAPRRSIALLALSLAACDGGRSSGEESRTLDATAPAAAPAPPAMDMARGAAFATEGSAAKASGAAAAQLPGREALAAPMLIRTGRASVQVDSLAAGIDAVRELARRVGALIANTSVNAGERQHRGATLELRVPAARFDDLVGGLAPLGKLESVDVQVQDVGEEFTDVAARVANARRLEQRLVELLASRAGRLADVLAVERELARVREEIERYEGRMRYLRTHVATSTLTVSVHEPLPIVAGQPGRNPLGEAVRQAWRNFVGVIAVGIASLGVLVPLGAVGVGAWLLVRRWRRPRAAALPG